MAGKRFGVESTNWSGLIALGEPFQGGGTEPIAEIDGDWQVPAVTPTTPNAASATWIGIDGVADTSLIQVGTIQTSGGGKTSYSAFYEMLPASAVIINQPVAAGDEIAASIRTLGGSNWNISITDSQGVTTKWKSSFDVTYSTPGDTAEWIEEAPMVGGSQATLADFGSVQFTNLNLMSSIAPTSYPLLPVSLANANTGVVIAYPGPYDAGTDSFPITYGTPTPSVQSVSPAQGSTSGGTSVNINGDYLTGASSVTFGGVPVPFVYNLDNSITATSPPGAAGTVNITVTTPGGSSVGSFTYVAPPPPPPPTSPGSSSGYDLVGRDGGVFVFADRGAVSSARFRGSTSMFRTSWAWWPPPMISGYFLVGSDGGVFAFGDAPFQGSLPGERVHINNVVGIVPTANDRGYFLVGSDGGVFTFGTLHPSWARCPVGASTSTTSSGSPPTPTHRATG